MGKKKEVLRSVFTNKQKTNKKIKITNSLLVSPLYITGV
jgi:hypothetical protein